MIGYRLPMRLCCPLPNSTLCASAVLCQATRSAALLSFVERRAMRLCCLLPNSTLRASAILCPQHPVVHSLQHAAVCNMPYLRGTYRFVFFFLSVGPPVHVVVGLRYAGPSPLPFALTQPSRAFGTQRLGGGVTMRIPTHTVSITLTSRRRDSCHASGNTPLFSRYPITQWGDAAYQRNV